MPANQAGKRIARSTRHMGKQAHMMAMFSSIIVHSVDAMSSSKRPLVQANDISQVMHVHVMSGLVVEKRSVVARMMDVTVTLASISTC